MAYLSKNPEGAAALIISVQSIDRTKRIYARNGRTRGRIIGGGDHCKLEGCKEDPMDPAVQALTPLPCPSCGVNLLEKGFYNYCSETTSLREDNYLYVTQGRIYVDHSEDGHETQSHECEVDARCRDCDELLPWPLYELRDLDGSTPEAAEKVVAGFLERARPAEGGEEAQA